MQSVRVNHRRRGTEIEDELRDEKQAPLPVSESLTEGSNVCGFAATGVADTMKRPRAIETGIGRLRPGDNIAGDFRGACLLVELREMVSTI